MTSLAEMEGLEGRETSKLWRRKVVKEGRATRKKGRATRMEGRATQEEGPATQKEGPATSKEGRVTRKEGWSHVGTDGLTSADLAVV
jgi:hypothetical protein